MVIATANTKVYLALGNTDMRKAINGLSMLVEGRLELDPFSGHLFVFCNRRRNIDGTHVSVHGLDRDAGTGKYDGDVRVVSPGRSVHHRQGSAFLKEPVRCLGDVDVA